MAFRATHIDTGRGRDASERAFRDAGLADRVRWIEKGQAVEL